jgi:ribosomal protein L2
MTHTKPIRECIRCDTKAHTEDELNLFCKEKKGKHGRRNLCKPCNRKKETEWRNKYPHLMIKKTQKYHAERVYKISLDEYTKRMATSNVCEVCGSDSNLGYDHCHTTMEFRGVLCNKCNRSIGQLGDTLGSIRNVIQYLEKEKYEG